MKQWIAILCLFVASFPFAYAQEENEDGMEEILIQGISFLHDRNFDYYRNARPRILSLLKDKGVDPNFKEDTHGVSLIHIASGNGDVEMIHILLDAGVNVNVKDAYSCTPLMWASWRGQVQAIGFLLQRGANINAVSANKTAFGYAMKYQELDAMAELIIYGADIKRHVRGYTFQAGVRMGKEIKISPAILFALANNAVVPISFSGEDQILIDTVEYWLSLTPELRSDAIYSYVLNIEDLYLASLIAKIKRFQKERPALHKALLSGSKTSVLKVMKEKNVDINAQDSRGLTALSLAILSRKEKLIRILIQNGAELIFNNFDEILVLSIPEFKLVLPPEKKNIVGKTSSKVLRPFGRRSNLSKMPYEAGLSTGDFVVKAYIRSLYQRILLFQVAANERTGIFPWDVSRYIGVLILLTHRYGTFHRRSL